MNEVKVERSITLTTRLAVYQSFELILFRNTVKKQATLYLSIVETRIYRDGYRLTAVIVRYLGLLCMESAIAVDSTRKLRNVQSTY